MADDNKSFFGTVLTWFFVAILAIAAFKLAFWMVGAAVGIGGFLIFTVGPILLVGWLAVKVFRLFRPKDPYEPA